RELVSKLAAPHIKAHPEWEKTARSSDGVPASSYSPELQKLLREELDARPASAPVGWTTGFTFSREFGQTYFVVIGAAEAHRAAHPEWFKNYENTSGRVVEHYAPELQKILREDLKDAVLRPDGWKTLSEIRKEQGRNAELVEQLLAEQVAQHPEWKKGYLTPRGKFIDHYSPEAEKKILDALRR
ncbi:MAG: hypothetical protein IT290_00890, partial [Deltaproteobacteria bacterium]|nr:hypothetical protein [Deltaproteobacteria bacterium]